MSDTIFVPITCAACQRTSALGLPAEELQEKLENRRSITLRCGFDGEIWEAGPRERERIARLCDENKAVPPRDSFKLSREWLRDSV